jgi:tRNA (guanine-N7-)-methyltransferase
VTQAFRHIRSYVRREGRMTESQRQALEYYWQDYGIPFSRKYLDLETVFGRRAPTILDIGTGMGDSCVSIAKQNPENNYLAVEVHRPGVGSLLRQIRELKLHNIRISNHDAVEVLQYQLPPNSLDAVFIFFPDPWPKKRHFKRRLVNPDFLRTLAKCLKSHGRVYIATDWKDYSESIMDAFAEVSGYINLAGEQRMAPRPYWRPLTKFERRGIKLEHEVFDLVFIYKGADSTSLKS